MKKFNTAALILAGAFLVGLGTSVSAEDMKCGAGKCGKAMQMPASKCGADMKEKAKCDLPKCDVEKKAEGKCGGQAKEAPKKAMKCGNGKCG
ncbi:hypothetical protein KJ877_09855 [bacterium]|nr:hypothetical protein [bacterium]MBU1991260.1 hypothetical protein [bacterium]